MGTSQPLEYAPANPRRRFHWTWIVGPLLIMAISVRMGYPPAAAQYFQQTMRYYEASQQLRRMMRYSAPADQVVISEETVPKVPPVNDLLPGIALFPKSNVTNEFSLPGLPPIAFMHSRSFEGQTYLIIVQYIRQRFRIGPHLAVSIGVPGTLQSYPEHLMSFVGMDIPPWFDNASKKIFAGQIDPYDDSHFTIHYELNGKPYDLDGQLVAPTDPNYYRPVDVKDPHAHNSNNSSAPRISE